VQQFHNSSYVNITRGTSTHIIIILCRLYFLEILSMYSTLELFEYFKCYWLMFLKYTYSYILKSSMKEWILITISASQTHLSTYVVHPLTVLAKLTFLCVVYEKGAKIINFVTHFLFFDTSHENIGFSWSITWAHKMWRYMGDFFFDF
jgi:hypothetical protein